MPNYCFLPCPFLRTEKRQHPNIRFLNKSLNNEIIILVLLSCMFVSDNIDNSNEI